MPKRVDHAERRAHIIDALVRVAAREGLHTVTMRRVAAEAGISLNLVQYYFDTKAALMNTALEHLERQSHARWDDRLKALPRPPTPRAFLDTLIAEALPADPDSRAFHLVWTSYAVLAMTDPELAAQPFVAGPDRLEARIADVLRHAQDGGTLAAGTDPDHEAARLLALVHGLATGVLIGQRQAQQAERILAEYLERLFTAESGGPAPS